MKNNKVLNILCILASLACVGCSLFTISKMSLISFYGTASAFFTLVAVILGTYYVISGYAKSDALEYKMFLVFFGLVELMMIGTLSKEVSEIPAFINVMRTAAFGGIVALAIGKDLGKNVSVAISVLILLFEAGTFFFLLFTTKGILRGGEALETIKVISAGVRMFMSQLTLDFVVGKYRDKNARGSK